MLDRKPADLSGGQRQRVAMGRAIVRDAKVFLMDEPLSNLDAKLRVSMRTEIAKIHRRIGATTIYVTHDQTEAMTLADRIVIMSSSPNSDKTGTVGRVEQIGTPQELYNEPANKFVAGFIGSPAMNFFNVKVASGKLTNNEGLNMDLPEGKAKLLKEQGYEGKEVILGIRPDNKPIQIKQLKLKLSFLNFLEQKLCFILELVQLNLFLVLKRVISAIQEKKLQWL